MRRGRAVARRFAETMLHWRGRLRTEDLREYLGVSERTARRLISDWRGDGILSRGIPGSERGLAPGRRFAPDPSVTDPAVTLSLLLNWRDTPGNPFAECASSIDAHDLFLASPPPSGRIKEVIAALLDREASSLIYASKTGTQEFVFSPSALVRTRGRYHLRGYRDGGRDGFGRPLDNRYVDVVPARVIEAERTASMPFVGLDEDVDWHAQAERRLVLSVALGDEERICYEHEYGIAETGGLTIRLRRALMPYALQELAERRCWRSDGTSVSVWALAREDLAYQTSSHAPLAAER